MSARDDVAHINHPALPRFKRPETPVNVFAEQSQFFYVMQHLPTNILLIRRWQPFHLRQGLLQCLRHATEYTIPVISRPHRLYEPTANPSLNHGLRAPPRTQNPRPLRPPVCGPSRAPSHPKMRDVPTPDSHDTVWHCSHVMRFIPRIAHAPLTSKRPEACPHCGSGNIARKGTRRKKLEIVQLWRCSSCKRKFTPGPQALHNKTYPLRLILSALTDYDLGCSLEETAARLRKKAHRRVSPSTIAAWLYEYKQHCTYRRLRRGALVRFPAEQTIRSIKLYQRFMLANDSVTVAIEIPIWLEEQDIVALERQHSIELAAHDRDKSRVITGHIDFLQVRNGAVHILDYKPDACRSPGSPSTRLR
jgi:transposase-like protein